LRYQQAIPPLDELGPFSSRWQDAAENPRQVRLLEYFADEHCTPAMPLNFLKASEDRFASGFLYEEMKNES